MTPPMLPGSAHCTRHIRSGILALLLLVLLALAACSSPQVARIGLIPPTVDVVGAASAPTAPPPTATPVPTATLAPTMTPTTPPPTATATATSTATATFTVTPTITPDELLNPLTGLRVDDPAKLKRRPLAVRIGNDPEARPQEGLSLADIVYEEIMEGFTVTRFTALFLGQDAERIRPIRSARLSSLAIAPQYDAALVHSGASDTIRWRISQASFTDLDEYFHPKPYSILRGYDWRGRVYTSGERLHSYLQEKKLERDTPITGYTFDPTPPQGDPATSIHIPYPRSSVVDWAYDAAKGQYLREVRGQPHQDGSTQEQLGADNVIIFYTEHILTDIIEDVNGARAIDIVLSGAGRALICRDGVVVEARWEQKMPNTLIQYYDASGQIIPLKPGNTWIELSPLDYEVKIQ